MGIFEQFNKKFSILIDLYEDDFIKTENLAEALEMTKTFAAENVGCQFEETIRRFMEAAELTLANKV